MKTITTTSLVKKIAKLTVKSVDNPYPISKNSIAYKLVNSLLFSATTIRPCYVIGSGKNASNQDHTEKVRSLLQKMGVEYVFSNDAPRGGLAGNLIVITTKIKSK